MSYLSKTFPSIPHLTKILVVLLIFGSATMLSSCRTGYGCEIKEGLKAEQAKAESGKAKRGKSRLFKNKKRRRN